MSATTEPSSAESSRPSPEPAPSSGGPSRAAQWLGVAANLGALVGLLLVVVQLRQNRDLMRAQVRHELASGATNVLLQTAVNPQLASVMRRANAGDSLTPDEAVQFRSRSNALLRYAEDVHYQYRQGLYDEEEFTRQKEAWRLSFERSVAFSRYWCEVRPLYSPRFAATMDSLVPAGTCPATP